MFDGVCTEWTYTVHSAHTVCRRCHRHHSSSHSMEIVLFFLFFFSWARKQTPNKLQFDSVEIFRFQTKSNHYQFTFSDYSWQLQRWIWSLVSSLPWPENPSIGSWNYWWDCGLDKPTESRLIRPECNFEWKMILPIGCKFTSSVTPKFIIF